MSTIPPRVTLDTPFGPDVDLNVEDVRWESGHRVTQSAVDDLVTDLHERTAGRPSLTAPGAHSPSVTLRFPTPVLERIDAEAARRGVRRSEIVREAVELYLAS